MGVIQLILVLIAIGCLLAAANKWLPMDPKIKQIMNVVVVVLVVLWLLALFFPGVSDIRVRPIA